MIKDAEETQSEGTGAAWWAVGLALGATTATVYLLMKRWQNERSADPNNWLSRCDSAIKNLESRVHIPN